MTMLSASPAQVSDTAFLRDFAETRRFLAGRPVNVQVTPDGKSALFLRSGPRDNSQLLYELDLATGTTKELLTPTQVLNGASDTLSVEEKARLERQRVSARGFINYQLSVDGSKLLVGLSGKLYVVERASGKATQLKTGEGACIDPRFSPDGRFVAYVRENDVRVIELAKNVEKQVTKGGTAMRPHGLAEFVAQEEMSRFSGFWFSPDSKFIVFQETDHTGMETFTVTDPMHPERAGDGFFYPRPGKKNATVKLGITSINGGAVKWVKWSDSEFPYLATVRWNDGPLTLVVQNREQTKEQVLSVDEKSGATKVLLTEEDAAWLNLEQAVPLWWKGEGFFWVTERNGAAEVELRGVDGSLKSSWVKPGAGYVNLLGFDAASKTLFFTGGTNPTAQVPFKVIDGGAPIPLAGGWSEGRAVVLGKLTGDNKFLAFSSTTLQSMPKSSIVSIDGSRTVLVPSVAEEPSLRLTAEIFQLENDGAWVEVIRPANFEKGRKYPVILEVYGGPGHQQVTQALQRNLIPQWLANQGFIVAMADGRGTPNRTRAWERAIKNDFATITSGDQLAALKALGKRVPEMDLTRVGVDGWSFGGYLSALMALKHGDAIKSSVAGAPVVDWLDYDTHYTERYLGVPGEQSKAYEVSSLLGYVKDAKRPILLIHGTADDNVYFLHTLKLSDAMFKAGKPHSVLPLTNFTHMVPEPLVTQRLYERIATWFKETL